MTSAVVAFDFDDVLPIVRRAHSRASLEDAEDAVQTAVAELLEKGTALTAPNVVTRARSRLIDHFKRREAGNRSLDAALEDDVDHAPRDLAVDDRDVAAETVERMDLDRHPIRGLLAAAVEAGYLPTMHRRGPANPLWRGRQRVVATPGWDRDLCIAAVKCWAEEHGRPPQKRDLESDPCLPGSQTFQRIFGTLNTMLEAAGFERQLAGWARWETPDAVLNAYADFHRRHGRWPEARECRNANGLPGAKVTIGFFGTTRIAHIAALVGDRG